MSVVTNKRYVFSEHIRSAPFVLFLFCGAGMLFATFSLFFVSEKWQGMVLFCAIAMTFGTVVQLVDGFCNARYRKASYTIQNRNLRYQIGQRTDVISSKDSFYLSKLTLWESSGRSYGHECVYIVLWQGQPPLEGRHPFKLIHKRGCYVFPNDTETEQLLLQWCADTQQRIPNFPRTLYHPESSL